MGRYTESDEVILYESSASVSGLKGMMKIILTSEKIFIESEKGFFKKELITEGEIYFEDIKFHHNNPMIRKKGNTINIQTINGDIDFEFDGFIEASRFNSKLIDAVTDTTIAERGSRMVKDAFDMADDTLNMDTREAIKGVLKNGIVGTLLNGTKRKNER